MITHSDTPAKKISAHDRILLTAHNLFYKYGIRATGIDLLIKEAGVTKTTFYRHFPSKDTLIIAFLEYRHQHWITWFNRAVDCPNDITKALAERFENDDFRGCAFINTVGEIGITMLEATDISIKHKQEMTNIIHGVLPETDDRLAIAKAIALSIDGAIVQVQREKSPEPALQALNKIIESLLY